MTATSFEMILDCVRLVLSLSLSLSRNTRSTALPRISTCINNAADRRWVSKWFLNVEDWSTSAYVRRLQLELRLYLVLIPISFGRDLCYLYTVFMLLHDTSSLTITSSCVRTSRVPPLCNIRLTISDRCQGYSIRHGVRASIWPLSLICLRIAFWLVQQLVRRPFELELGQLYHWDVWSFSADSASSILHLHITAQNLLPFVYEIRPVFSLRCWLYINWNKVLWLF